MMISYVLLEDNNLRLSNYLISHFIRIFRKSNNYRGSVYFDPKVVYLILPLK